MITAIRRHVPSDSFVERIQSFRQHVHESFHRRLIEDTIVAGWKNCYDIKMVIVNALCLRLETIFDCAKLLIG